MKNLLCVLSWLVIVFLLFASLSWAFSGVSRVGAQAAGKTLSVEWQHFLPGTDGVSVIQTSDGGYLALGLNYSTFSASNSTEVYSQPLVVKTDSSGNIVWEKIYTLTDLQHESSELDKAVQTIDGYVLAGRVGETAVVLVKVDPQGNILWQKSYAPLGYLYAFIQTNDGGFAILGELTEASLPLPEFGIVKIDSSGNLLWNITTGTSALDPDYPFYGLPTSIFQTIDQGYIIVSNDATSGPDSVPFQMFKLDSEGNLLWTQTFSPYDYMSVASSLALKDGYLIAGWVPFNGHGDSQPVNRGFVIKTDLQGNLVWNKTYSYSGLQSLINSISNDTSGFMFLGSATGSYGVPAYVWVADIGFSGEIEGQLAIPLGNYRPFASSIIQTNDGAHVFVGTWNFSDYGVLTREFWIVKISSTTQTPTSSFPPSPSVPEFPSVSFLILFAISAVSLLALKKKWVHPGKARR